MNNPTKTPTTHRYGLVRDTGSRQQHQRYFRDFHKLDGGLVEVELLTGDWVAVKEESVVRYPGKEE